LPVLFSISRIFQVGSFGLLLNSEASLSLKDKILSIEAHSIIVVFPTIFLFLPDPSPGAVVFDIPPITKMILLYVKLE
jgi:hypothetical protein